MDKNEVRGIMEINSSFPQLIDVIHVHRNATGAVQAARHDEHVLTLLVKGSGYYYSGPLLLPDAPWYAIFPKGDEDRYRLQGEYESWYVLFNWPEMEMRPIGDTQIQIAHGNTVQSIPRCIQPDDVLVSRTIRSFERIQAGLRRRDLSGQLRTQSAFLELFSTFMEAPASFVDLTTHQVITEFRNLLEIHAFDAIPIEELAMGQPLTLDHTRILFKRTYGVTPQAYRTSVRLSHAFTLLRSSTLNVSEVATRVGYQDALYFSRAFRGQYGFPPSHVPRLFNNGEATDREQ